jgi:hypothetical protein
MNPHTFFVSLTCAFALTAAASAQETPVEIARRELITQAESASDTGDHARALDLATRAAQIRVTTSLRLMLAQEHRSLGHTLAALDAAGRCASEARGDLSLRNRERILAACESLATSLRAEVARVSVRVEGATDATRVTANGAEIPRALWETPWTVLPGHAVFEASGDGHETARVEIDARAGGEDTVTLTLRPAPTGSPAATRPNLTVAPGAATSAAPPRRAQPVAPWVLVGAGVASVGAGVAFVLLQNDALTARDAACASYGCRASAWDDNRRAEAWNVAANAAFIAGGAMIGGGVLWYLLARPRAEHPRTALNVGVAPWAGGAALWLGGAL